MRKKRRRENGIAEIAHHGALVSASPFRPFAPSYLAFSSALKFWLWLGFVSFGGPAGQIALMHRELIERKRWIEEDKFLHALNFCLLLPGPEAQQLATYHGWRLHGTTGGIAAGALFVLPSIFVLLGLSYLYAVYGNLPFVAGILSGLKAVVLAVVVEAVFKIGKKSLQTRQHFIVAALAFAAIYFFRVAFPIVVLSAAIVGLLGSLLQTGKAPPKSSGVGFDFRSALLGAAKTTAVCFALWLIPLAVAGFWFGWRSLPIKIYLFFTQAAFVTFGGAYAVLVYVNQAAVDSFGWITTEQAINGFALAETTPGPLIMVLQFVGFMAGWNNAPAGSNQTIFAVACALLTTFATFLPSFLFVFACAPFVESLQNNQKLKASLATVAAAIVGVVLTLAATFGANVIFADQKFDWFAVALAAVALSALVRFKTNVLWLILAGALAGSGKTLLQL